jgi:hypothetical protein
MLGLESRDEAVNVQMAHRVTKEVNVVRKETQSLSCDVK